MTAYQIDTSRGAMRDDLSRQWASRPADERFLNLTDLHAQTYRWATQSRNIVTVPAAFEVGVIDDDLALGLDGEELRVNHYSIGQLATLAKVPVHYLRDPLVPPDLVARCLRNGLGKVPQRALGAYLRTEPGNGSLRAITGPTYGRIFDHEVVAALMKIAGNGTGDSRWKIPGCIDWATHSYDAEVPVTLDTTTLFASDRNLFWFLCDDRNPVEVGLLANGQPDLMFRGFMGWNSEVMERSLGIAGFWLRGVCGNRCLWGVEGFQELVIRHTSGAPARFAEEVAPLLATYAEGGVADVAAKVQTAKAVTFRDRDNKADEQIDFLTSRMGFNRQQAAEIIGTDPDGGPMAEHNPSNLWELTNAATAWARSIPHQDDRLAAEQKVGKVMAGV